MSSSSASQSVPHAGPESIHVDGVINQRSMQKRQEIGLGPPRPTAKTEIQRPPETAPASSHLWGAMLVFILLMIATAVLVVTRLLSVSSDELYTSNDIGSWLVRDSTDSVINSFSSGTNTQLNEQLEQQNRDSIDAAPQDTNSECFAGIDRCSNSGRRFYSTPHPACSGRRSWVMGYGIPTSRTNLSHTSLAWLCGVERFVDS